MVSRLSWRRCPHGLAVQSFLPISLYLAEIISAKSSSSFAFSSRVRASLLSAGLAVGHSPLPSPTTITLTKSRMANLMLTDIAAIRAARRRCIAIISLSLMIVICENLLFFVSLTAVPSGIRCKDIVYFLHSKIFLQKIYDNDELFRKHKHLSSLAEYERKGV